MVVAKPLSKCCRKLTRGEHRRPCPRRTLVSTCAWYRILPGTWYVVAATWYTQQHTMYPLGASTAVVCTCMKNVIQGASLCGRLPPATLAHNMEELNKMRMSEADREVDGFRGKLATCKCQELHVVHENNPDAACMDEIERTERGQCTVPVVTPHQLRCVVNGCAFDFFVRFENTASCINARGRAGSSQLCLLACVDAP